MSFVVVASDKPSPVRVLDPEQALIDLDEAEAQLGAVAKAAEIVEQQRAIVAGLKRELNAAKQQLQTAEWNVVAIARAIADRRRRRAKR